MLSFVQQVVRPSSTKPTGSRSFPAAVAFIERIVGLKEPRYVRQLLGQIVSNDDLFHEHVGALIQALKATTEGEVLDAPVLGRMANLAPLVDSINVAFGEAQAAEVMGVASSHQRTLSMHASITYRSDAPPPVVLSWIAAYQKVPLALLVLLYLGRHVPAASETLLGELVRIIEEGYLARLSHLAALGYTVPAAFVPREQRADMNSLFADDEEQMQGLREEAVAFASVRSSSRGEP